MSAAALAVEDEAAPSPEGRIAYLLMRLAALMSGPFRRELAERQIAQPVARTVAVVSDWGAMPVSKLADLCLLQQPTMTKLLGRMTRDGLVTRRPGMEDKRVVLVDLTPKGRALAAEVGAMADRHEAAILEWHPAVRDAANAELLAAAIKQMEGRS